MYIILIRGSYSFCLAAACQLTPTDRADPTDPKEQEEKEKKGNFLSLRIAELSPLFSSH